MKTKPFFFVTIILMAFFAFTFTSCGKCEMDGVGPNGTTVVVYNQLAPPAGHVYFDADPGRGPQNLPVGSTLPITKTVLTPNGYQLALLGYGQEGVDMQDAVHDAWQHAVSDYMTYWNTTQTPPAYSIYIDATHGHDTNYPYVVNGITGAIENW